MIEIDGSLGSGGGQILRTAVSLSVITQKPCHIFNIRKNRPKPGLMLQHLSGIQAMAKFCGGSLEGDFLSSEDIKFYPSQNYRDSISIDIPTAGSITLVLQALIPAILFAPKAVKVAFNGGATDTFFSPTIDYFRFVFLKILEKMGAKVETNILKRGYYPEGGAKVEVIVSSAKSAPQQTGSGAGLKNINLTERGALKKILVVSGASNFLKNPEGVASRPYGTGKKVAERQLMGVREILGKLKLPVEEVVQYYPTDCPGSQICLIAEFENTLIGTDNLGKLGKRAEDVGKEAALELLKEQKSGACLDKHLADQILVFMPLASGKSQVTVSEITNHCQTNIRVIEKFFPGKLEIKNNSINWFPK